MGESLGSPTSEGSIDVLAELVEGTQLLTAPHTTLEKIEVRKLAEQPALTMRSRTTPEDLDPGHLRVVQRRRPYMGELGAGRAGPPVTISFDPDALRTT